MAAGRWAEAKCIVLDHAPADARAEVELFFTSTAERLAGEGDRSSGRCDASPARAG